MPSRKNFPSRVKARRLVALDNLKRAAKAEGRSLLSGSDAAAQYKHICERDGVKPNKGILKKFMEGHKHLHKGRLDRMKAEIATLEARV